MPGPGTLAIRAFAAALVMSLSLGSIHAFSIFVAPLEVALDRGRGDISLIYSVALVCLTLAVLGGHRLYDRFRPATLAAAACLAAAAGLAIATLGTSYPLWLLGYGLIFGAANGVGYGFALVLGARAWPAREGLAMGSVTAVYALGASLFVKLFDWIIQGPGPAWSLATLGLVLLAVAGLCFHLLRDAPKGHDEGASAEKASALDKKLLAFCWLGYGGGVAAGLMAIGHAAGIAAAAGAAQPGIVVAAMVIVLGNALGGIMAGFLADLAPVKVQLLALPLLSAGALALLAGEPSPSLAIACLAGVGFAYGATISCYPIAVRRFFGARDYAKAYGRIFTAWGLAGLAGPWLAGALYDRSGDYGLALWMAAITALLSAAVTLTLPAGTARAKAT